MTSRSSATVHYVSSWFGRTSNWLILRFCTPHRGLVGATLQLSLERLGGSFSDLLLCQIAWLNPSPISSPISYTSETDKQTFVWWLLESGMSSPTNGKSKCLTKTFKKVLFECPQWWTRCSYSQWWCEITTMHLVSYEKYIAETWSKGRCMYVGFVQDSTHIYTLNDNLTRCQEM